MDIFCKDCYLIDMTQLIDENIATWEGECGFQAYIDVDYKDHRDRVRLMRYEMFAGVGTHIDSPALFNENGKTVSDLFHENFFSKGAVIDVSYKVANDCDFNLSKEDILEWEDQNGRLEPESIFLVYTGWSKNWADKNKYRNPDEDGDLHFPGLSLDAVEVLIERDVVAIGIDTLSIDGGKKEPEGHKKFLSIGGKYIIENVANIDRLPSKGAYILVAPLKIKRGTEVPVRMFGIVAR